MSFLTGLVRNGSPLDVWANEVVPIGILVGLFNSHLGYFKSEYLYQPILDYRSWYLSKVKSHDIVHWVKLVFIGKLDLPCTIIVTYWGLRSSFDFPIHGVNGKSTMLEILDTAGSEQFASLQDLYIRNGHGFVLVYSITSFHSLLNLEAVYQQILRYKAKFRQRSSAKVDHPSEVPPIILVGNKVDLESTFREVAKEDAENIARRWGCCGFVETSAKNGDGVMDVFRQVVLRLNKEAQLVTCSSAKLEVTGVKPVAVFSSGRNGQLPWSNLAKRR
ncbi:hypothetical protein ACTXT7_000363 [Hymenolepis weldensis]